MELQTDNAPEVSPEQRAAVERVKRIRKLRWIGLEDEADLVEVELAAHFVPAADPSSRCRAKRTDQ
jgi:hypothetical protein